MQLRLIILTVSQYVQYIQDQELSIGLYKDRGCLSRGLNMKVFWINFKLLAFVSNILGKGFITATVLTCYWICSVNYCNCWNLFVKYFAYKGKRQLPGSGSVTKIVDLVSV